MLRPGRSQSYNPSGMRRLIPNLLAVLLSSGTSIPAAGAHHAQDAETAVPSPESGAADHDRAEANAAAHGGNTPALSPRPDSGFFRAADWERGETEVLEYAVLLPGKSDTARFAGRLETRLAYLATDGLLAGRRAHKEDEEILSATLQVAGKEGDVPFSEMTVSQMRRTPPYPLLRQEQSLQGRYGAVHRSLDCRAQPPRLRIASSGAEATRDTVLSLWPVYTEAMLFTYLRALPQRKGYREEVWLHDWGPAGRLASKPGFAVITVREKLAAIRDMDAWYVTVERETGPRSEFWIAASGLHPVVAAMLADGASWTLKGIGRRKSGGK